MTSKPSGEHVIGSHDDFFAAAKTGSLPNFVYLEPKWGWGTGVGIHQGTDYHPPTNVGPAEVFLVKVFSALQASKQWGKMLFIVTFDEHGGTYDHVKPAWGAINPDGKIGDQGFRFDLFGARVPTIFASPYIARNTVFRAPPGSQYPFDHTSFIKTLLLWAGVDPNSSTLGLGARMPKAPTFDWVLSKTPVNNLDLDVKAAPYEEGETLNSIFEGVGRAAVRKIMYTSKTVEQAEAEAARYRKNPAAYEKELKAKVR